MAQVRQLLKHVCIERALGTRRCKRNRQHEITRGEWCVAIRDDGTPYQRVYCRDCALPMFRLCAKSLREFRDTLYPDLASPSTRPDQQTDSDSPSGRKAA